VLPPLAHWTSNACYRCPWPFPRPFPWPCWPLRPGALLVSAAVVVVVPVVVVVVPVVVVVVVVVVVPHAPTVSPCRRCAGQALTLIEIVTPGCFTECVLWQIVTFPVVGTVVVVVAPVVVVAVVVSRATDGLLAIPTPTKPPETASTAVATAPPTMARARRL
jgi:hypothetical protein